MTPPSAAIGSTERDRLAFAFADLASKAGAEIMAVYAADFAVLQKADRSPLTEADLRAEAVIVPALHRLLPGVPVISEESFGAEVGARADALELAGRIWLLVDPLDGTREFVGRNGEFTVNVALIEGDRPVAGCVYAPAIGRLYIGGSTARAGALHPGDKPGSDDLSAIATRARPAPGPVAVASRSHRDERTDAFLREIGAVDTRSIGSSLKFCLVAEASADVYPRFGPTMEWDTAAGHAVVLAAGGAVLTPEGDALRYGKREDGLRNGPFVAWGVAPTQRA